MPRPVRLQGLPPLVDARTRVLVLGSFPGAASLAARQYYGHPRNHFWPVLRIILAPGPREMDLDSYENKSRWLLGQGVGLWDVYASCERSGSLDASIRKPALNDFAQLRSLCPHLCAIVHNGAESFRHAPLVGAALGEPALAFFKLPSTSPANASWRLEDKAAAWRDAFIAAGLPAVRRGV